MFNFRYDSILKYFTGMNKVLDSEGGQWPQMVPSNEILGLGTGSVWAKSLEEGYRQLRKSQLGAKSVLHTGAE
jgi:hypothetical protein